MTDPSVSDFSTMLTSRARDAYRRCGPSAHAQLVKALAAGWTPNRLAEGVSRALPVSGGPALVQRRLEWFATHTPADVGAKPLTFRKPGPCQHTDDVNGWLMDSTGAITGKCPCWAAS